MVENKLIQLPCFYVVNTADLETAFAYIEDYQRDFQETGSKDSAFKPWGSVIVDERGERSLLMLRVTAATDKWLCRTVLQNHLLFNVSTHVFLGDVVRQTTDIFAAPDPTPVKDQVAVVQVRLNNPYRYSFAQQKARAVDPLRHYAIREPKDGDLLLDIDPNLSFHLTSDVDWKAVLQKPTVLTSDNVINIFRNREPRS